TPARSRSRSPRAKAQATAVAPAATKDRPRVVRPASARLTGHFRSGSLAGGRHGQSLDQVGDDLLGAPPLHLSLGGGQQPVGEDGDGEVLDVVGQDVVAVV